MTLGKISILLQKNSSVLSTSMEDINHSIKLNSVVAVENSINKLIDVKKTEDKFINGKESEGGFKYSKMNYKKTNHDSNESFFYKSDPDYIVNEKVSSIKNNNVATESSIDIKLISHILNEECYLDSDQTLEDTQHIYMDMTGLSNNIAPKKDNCIDERFAEVDNDYEELDNFERQEINGLENKKKPKLPPRNLTTEGKEISTAKIKSELAGYIKKIFTDSGFEISKHKLIEGFNKELSLDLFSSKNIDDVKIEKFISYCVNYGSSLDYDKFKNDKELINKIKNYLFVFSYIFNKEVKRDVSGFFTEEFYKLNKLNEFQKLNLYADIVDKIVDCIIDKKELVKSLVNILDNKKNKIMKKIIFLNGLIEHKGDFIEDKIIFFNALKKIIESSVIKLDKTSLVNKIRLSETSKKNLIKNMISIITNKLPLSMDDLSSSIIDKSEIKKKITNDFLNEIEHIPVELILSKEHRKFTNEIINIFIEKLKKNNMSKIPNDIKLYSSIDKELMLLYFKVK